MLRVQFKNVHHRISRDKVRWVFVLAVAAVFVVLFLFTVITSLSVQQSAQIYTSTSELAGKYVMTPFGQRLNSDVITIPSGSTVLSNGEVLEPNGLLLNMLNVTILGAYFTQVHLDVSLQTG